jgi:hypothetical protein
VQVVVPDGVTTTVPPGAVVSDAGTTTVVFCGGDLLLYEKQPASASDKKSARNRIRRIRASLCFRSMKRRTLRRILLRTPSCRGGAADIDVKSAVRSSNCPQPAFRPGSRLNGLAPKEVPLGERPGFQTEAGFTMNE